MSLKDQKELTPEQESLLQACKQEWLGMGLSTKPVDRRQAEEDCRKCYISRGQTPPTTFHWGRSPMEGAKIAAPLLGKTPKETINLACYGNQDLYWLGYWEFARKIGATSEADPQPFIELAKNCGWWWPMESEAVLTEFPIRILSDGEGRRHSTTQLAVEYSDGWGYASVHGVRVPREWVLEPLDPTVALTHQSVEMRRAAAAIVGWDKVLDAVHARVIQEDADPMIGTLLEVDLPDSPNSRFLRVQCGTGRKFVLPVPATCTTALEANAMTYGFSVDDFNIGVRT